jgi:hypothetical protein
MIYVVQCSGSGFCKVGHSSTMAGVMRRISALQTGNPSELFLLGTADGGFERESEIHRQHMMKRVRHNGEWFRLSQDDVDEILGGHRKMISSVKISERQMREIQADFDNEKGKRQANLSTVLFHLENLVDVVERLKE